ncbi:MAG: hypothetical protein ACLFOY_02085 [Desulfatibacillaceae bacterium]
MKGDNLPAIQEVRPPSLSDYRAEAIGQAVMRYAVKSPATVWPMGIGAGIGMLGWLFGVSLLYVPALAGILFGPVWAGLQLTVYRDKNGKRYLQDLQQRQVTYEEHLRDKLRRELLACRGLSGVDDPVDNIVRQGMTQFSRIQDKLGNVRQILDDKLDPREMTYSRFLGTAEQASLSVLDNLKGVVYHLKSASSIDANYVEDRLRDLAGKEKLEELSGEDREQKAALEERRTLREEQLKKARTLLARNEAALTEMEKISAAVAEWDSGGKFARMDFESALERLQEMAKGAHEYNSR